MSYSAGQHVNNIHGGIAIAKGLIGDLSGIQKFGYAASVGTTFTTIWEGVTPYPYITTAGVLTLTSSNSAADNGTTVAVSGLDQNWDLVTETVTVGGAASTTTFLRVFRMATITCNTGAVNVGDISATVGGTVRAYILADQGQSLMAVYTVPRNYRAFILSMYASPSKQKEMTCRLITRPFDNGGSFNVKVFGTAWGAQFVRHYEVVEMLQSKTDIEVQCKVDATSGVSAGFELLLEKY
jgi:hypothetical protein